MTANRDLENRLATYYESERPFRAPDRVLVDALTTIDQTKQRRVFPGVPRRYPAMSNMVKLAAAAIGVIAVVAVGWALYGNTAGVGTATASPTLASTSPPTTTPTSASPQLPALTETFKSDLYGMSVGYPSGWRVEAAAAPWVAALPGLDDPPSRDTILNNAADNQFIGIASQPLLDRSGDVWTTVILGAPEWDAPCDPADTEPLTVDGASGILATCPERPLHALFADADRGYFVVLYGLDDRDLFDQVLASIELDPNAARWSSGPFIPAFTYDFPDQVEFDFGPQGENLFEVRVPEFAEAGTPSGLTFERIDGGRADPCDEGSEPVTIGPGAQATLDYLASIPGMQVDGSEPVTIGGIAGLQATVSSDGTTCDPMWAWSGEGLPAYSEVPLERERRVIALEVGDDHVFVSTYGEDTNPDWTPLVDELLASVEFSGT
jgi:hypothetical protein